MLIFLPVSVGALPAAWQNHVTRYLPLAAGQAVIGPTKFTPSGHLLSPWTGRALLCGYTAAVLIAAAVTISRRGRLTSKPPRLPPERQLPARQAVYGRRPASGDTSMRSAPAASEGNADGPCG